MSQLESIQKDQKYQFYLGEKQKTLKKLLTILLLFLCAISSLAVGLNREDITRLAPPQHLQTALDEFFLENKNFFKMDEKSALQKSWNKATSRKNNISQSSIFKKIKQDLNPKYKELQSHLLRINCSVLKNDEKSIVFTGPQFSNYICKMPGSIFSVVYGKQQHNLLRIEGARLIQALIEKKERSFSNEYSNMMYVPQKHLYHIPWAGTELNDNNYIVVVEKIDYQKDKFFNVNNLDVSQYDALLSIVLEAGYDDIHSQNIVFDNRERLLFLDTEECYFPSQNTNQSEERIISEIEEYQRSHKTMPLELLFVHAIFKNNIPEYKANAHTLYKNIFLCFDILLNEFITKEKTKNACLKKHVSNLVEKVKRHHVKLLNLKITLQKPNKS